MKGVIKIINGTLVIRKENGWLLDLRLTNGFVAKSGQEVECLMLKPEETQALKLPPVSYVVYAHTSDELFVAPKVIGLGTLAVREDDGWNN